jgi:hypothetical protein
MRRANHAISLHVLRNNTLLFQKGIQQNSRARSRLAVGDTNRFSREILHGKDSFRIAPGNKDSLHPPVDQDTFPDTLLEALYEWSIVLSRLRVEQMTCSDMSFSPAQRRESTKASHRTNDHVAPTIPQQGEEMFQRGIIRSLKENSRFPGNIFREKNIDEGLLREFKLLRRKKRETIRLGHCPHDAGSGRQRNGITSPIQFDTFDA